MGEMKLTTTAHGASTTPCRAMDAWSIQDKSRLIEQESRRENLTIDTNAAPRFGWGPSVPEGSQRDPRPWAMVAARKAGDDGFLLHRSMEKGGDMGMAADLLRSRPAARSSKVA